MLKMLFRAILLLTVCSASFTVSEYWVNKMTKSTPAVATVMAHEVPPVVPLMKKPILIK